MKPIKLVMIGNSYTFYHKMPETILVPLLAEAGWEVELCCLTKGSQYLINSANETDVLGEKVHAALTGAHFDYAIIQDQSTVGILDPQKHEDGVRAILKKLAPTGARVLLYGTWGRKEGSPFLEKHGYEAAETTAILLAEQKKVAAAEKLDVAHVGLPFRAITEKGEIELYMPDCSHPSYEGSYLAAVCLAARLTGKAPEEFSFCGQLDPAVAKTLRSAAALAL
ncbi:MAG: SGNH/GDSL hydrolase family protein [Clostridia bacterium]|nr:SGNH/GDSL hydrolase family protein [Clostridia bacterium]